VSTARPTTPPARERLTLPLLALAVCALASALIARGAGGGRPGAFGVAVALVVAANVITGVCSYRRAGSFGRAVVSPFAVAAVTWLVLFVLRPVELYFFPDHAALALGQLGFDLAALTRTVAIGALGCAAWCAAYVWALGTRERPHAERAQPTRARWPGGVAAIVLGTALWVALFIRHGGLAALVRSPVSVRADQRSSSYGFVGLWIVQGTALCALALLLGEGRSDRRALRRLVLVAVIVSAAAAVALELRGLAVFALISAVAIAVTLRPPSKAQVALGVAAALVAAVGLAYAQQVRAYTSGMATRSAIRTAVHTPPWAVYVSDVGTFDHFVAMRELVPAAVPYLDGATLREIPEALVPRGLWPKKPLGVDARVASYLYPGAPVAVPISLQGELYWNGGLVVVVLGSLVVGAAFGALGRVGLSASPRSLSFVVYAVALPFTHALLTRGLATMTENLLFALVGVCVACLCFGFGTRPNAVRARIAPSPLPEGRTADA